MIEIIDRVIMVAFIMTLAIINAEKIYRLKKRIEKLESGEQPTEGNGDNHGK